MHTSKSWMAILVVAALLLPTWHTRLDRSDVDAATTLSADELASAWGGVFGGKIGVANGGILELSCGIADEWPSNLPPAWDTNTETPSLYPCSNGLPHFLPRYASASDIEIAVGGTVTRRVFGAGSTPLIRVFVNGLPFGSVPCKLSDEFSSGTAHPGPANQGIGDQEVRPYNCPGPGTDSAIELFKRISLATAPVHQGLNSVRAVTVSNGFNDGQAQDQEIRFFCVGTADCLPSTVRLRPTANGDFNQFGATLPVGTTHLAAASDYPDPGTGFCSTSNYHSFLYSNGPGTQRELFFVGGSDIPPGLTFSSCTIKTHMHADGGIHTSNCPPTAFVSLMLRRFGAESLGGQVEIFPDKPIEYMRAMATNPFTGSAWTSNDFANLQVGFLYAQQSGPFVNVGDLALECQL